jgi:hypothetical protein
MTIRVENISMECVYLTTGRIHAIATRVDEIHGSRSMNVLMGPNEGSRYKGQEFWSSIRPWYSRMCDRDFCK